ncbi:hypothetical protein [Pseudomonas ovata]|uniref:hypothetical protein n=1 Tax=Pseudomonas ovata TaxID=1839709 RepID=UPI000D6A039C|nr:hypothetical protein [Pseudomonas ovata]
MATLEIRLAIENFNRRKRPEVLIECFEDSELTCWLLVASSNDDNEFDEVVDKEEINPAFIPEDDVLLQLATTFMSCLD